ncbi:Exocyst complex component 8 [Portunus trituberculatus]|uniref:Exocyst complex component 8 n=1 Tax=Portunus trituberculatus TaxID=210409 RepID=A0A5B7JEX6_PORTR|nr:Exocyst complex component 8 [Portunus trituberculatus]
MVLLQLADIGLDLTFALHILLLRDVEKWICDGRDKLVEAVKLRGQEDTWKTLKYENKEQLNKFIEDMNDIGIASIEKYVMDELCVGLTDNTVQFSRAFLSYLEDMLRLFWPETERLINESLTAIFSAQLRHCQVSLTEPLFKNEVSIHLYVLLPLTNPLKIFIFQFLMMLFTFLLELTPSMGLLITINVVLGFVPLYRKKCCACT